MTILWIDEYSVHVKLIDEQHKRFFQLLDMVTSAFYAGKKDIELEEVFRQLFEYRDYHFKTEEEYFKKFNFEGAPPHIAEHKAFDEQVSQMYLEVKKDKLATTVKLIEFMEDWLVHHIGFVDKQYTKCFNDHGLY